MTLLLDLADVARTSGLRVIELNDWEHNISAGGFEPEGVLCHHTGSYDSLTDAENDLDYARWLAFTGRSDLPPPLCNLTLSAECVVYVCSSGNANHAGKARAAGPMPAASDGSALYVGIEAMNSGSQGWGSLGKTASGEVITQGEAYARLCAALCRGYDWPASHVRAHRETSETGKWDPGLLDMDKHRDRTAYWINNHDEGLDMDEKTLRKILREEIDAKIGDDVDLEDTPIDNPTDKGAKRWPLKRLLWDSRNQVISRLDNILKALGRIEALLKAKK